MSAGELCDMAELIALPVATVIAGPAWHDEVYKKFDTDLWLTTGNDSEWTSRSLVHRGPFSVIRLGEDGQGGEAS